MINKEIQQIEGKASISTTRLIHFRTPRNSMLNRLSEQVDAFNEVLVHGVGPFESSTLWAATKTLFRDVTDIAESYASKVAETINKYDSEAAERRTSVNKGTAKQVASVKTELKKDVTKFKKALKKVDQSFYKLCKDLEETEASNVSPQQTDAEQQEEERGMLKGLGFEPGILDIDSDRETFEEWVTAITAYFELGEYGICDEHTQTYVFKKFVSSSLYRQVLRRYERTEEGSHFGKLMKSLKIVHSKSQPLFLRRQAYFLDTFPADSEGHLDFAFRAQKAIEYAELDSMTSQDHVLQRVLEFATDELKTLIYTEQESPTLSEIEMIVEKFESGRDRDERDLKLHRQTQVSNYSVPDKNLTGIQERVNSNARTRVSKQSVEYSECCKSRTFKGVKGNSRLSQRIRDM